MREVIRRSEIVSCHSVVEQSSQRAGAERSDFTESIERGACFCALLSISGLDLQRREIELVKIVRWLFFYRGGELLFLLGKISFSASQPARNDVKSGAVTIVREDIIQGFSCEIDLSKAQCR